MFPMMHTTENSGGRRYLRLLLYLLNLMYNVIEGYKNIKRDTLFSGFILLLHLS